MARILCNTSSKSKVERTAWPASNKTASFGMVERIVRTGLPVTKVPKVTDRQRQGLGPRLRLTPSSRATDQSVGHQAEQKIEDHSQIQLKRTMPRHPGQGWNEDEIQHVTQYDRQQSLEKIHERRRCRHRVPPPSFERMIFPCHSPSAWSPWAEAGSRRLLLPFF